MKLVVIGREDHSYDLVDRGLSSQHEELLADGLAHHLDVDAHCLVVEVQPAYAVPVLGLIIATFTSYPVISQYLLGFWLEGAASMEQSKWGGVYS